MLKPWIKNSVTWGSLRAVSLCAFAADDSAAPGVGDAAADFEPVDLNGTAGGRASGSSRASGRAARRAGLLHRIFVPMAVD